MAHPVFTRFPSKTLIKGGNLTARYSDVAVTPLGTATWGGPWGAAGQTYDASWFTHQMDVAVATGCNTVRIFGDLEQRIAGGMNETDYLSRWEAILVQAANRGLYVVAVGASAYQLEGVASSGVITTTARNLLKAWYNTIRTHTNVIAIDPIQESSAWVNNTQGNDPYQGEIRQTPISAAQLLTVQQTVYNDLKGESSTLPICFSGCQNDYFSAATFSSTSELWRSALPYSDYLDFHVYYEMQAKDIAPAIAVSNGRPILFSEFGLRGGGAFVGCTYEQMKRVVFNTGIDGVICFSLVDAIGEIHPNQDWGIADDGGTPLRSKGTVFATFPTVAEKSVSIFAERAPAGSLLRRVS